MIYSDNNTFHPEDAFVGYQVDTSASIVLKVCQDLKDNEWEREEVCMLVHK